MAITIPKFIRPDDWWQNEAVRQADYIEKTRYVHEMEEAEKRKLHLLQQEVIQKKQMEEAHQRQRRKLVESPAMQCTVTDGVNLWVAKFGDGWVDRNQMVAVSEQEGMEWSVLADRLRKINMMEEMADFVRIRT